MFNNLIESSSHKKELERKGTFFLCTIAAYVVLLAGASVASIYAYDAQLSEQNLDTATLVLPFMAEAIPQVMTPKTLSHQENRNTRSLAETTAAVQTPVRPNLIADIRNPVKAPDVVGTVASKEFPALPGTKVGTMSVDPVGGGAAGTPSFINGSGKENAGGTRGALEILERVGAPPSVPHVAPPRKTPPVVSLGVINGKALHNPEPVYPPLAKTTHTVGSVSVQVLLNEEGKVISAQAVSGPAMLREAAVRAAYQARFSPTLLSHQPVKASGTITYNFKLE